MSDQLPSVDEFREMVKRDIRNNARDWPSEEARRKEYDFLRSAQILIHWHNELVWQKQSVEGQLSSWSADYAKETARLKLDAAEGRISNQELEERLTLVRGPHADRISKTSRFRSATQARLAECRILLDRVTPFTIFNELLIQDLAAERNRRVKAEERIAALEGAIMKWWDTLDAEDAGPEDIALWDGMRGRDV